MLRDKIDLNINRYDMKMISKTNFNNESSKKESLKDDKDSFLSELKQIKISLNQCFNELKQYMMNITESNELYSNTNEIKIENDKNNKDNNSKLEVKLDKTNNTNEKLEKYLIKLTNDELKYMNNLIGQMNQISNQMSITTDKATNIISNIENSTEATKDILKDAKLETRTFIENISTDTYTLIKIFIILLFSCIVFYYLYTQV